MIVLEDESGKFPSRPRRGGEMGLREQIQKKIDAKEQELNDLQNQIREGRAYIQGLQETLKIVGREQQDTFEASDRTKVAVLRHGSLLSHAREAILKAGKPLHITSILKAIGKPDDKHNRISLSGSLAAYVRKGEIFTRPEPNTFGLKEMDKSAPDTHLNTSAHNFAHVDNPVGLRQGDSEEERKVAGRASIGA
jgi:hypothetical protein